MNLSKNSAAERNASAATAEVWVIAMGNPDRGDDRAGWEVAQGLRRHKLQDVQIREVRQLLPELADELRDATCLVFVDAALDYPAGHAVGCRILPHEAPGALPHSCTPAYLLYLLEHLYDGAPPAWCVGIGAAQFSLGAELSEPVQGGVDRAVALIERLILEVRAES